MEQPCTKQLCHVLQVTLGVDVEAFVRRLGSVYPFSFSELHLFNGVLPPQAAIARSRLYIVLTSATWVYFYKQTRQSEYCGCFVFINDAQIGIYDTFLYVCIV